MRKQYWARCDPIKNYFPLPNEIFSLGLSSTAIAIYGYLLFREDRKTYGCLASYRMIGEAIWKSVTTVRKYVSELEERGLITTERTSIMTKDGRKRNGCLRYHILPIQMSIDRFTEQQLRQPEVGAARQKVQSKLSRLCEAQEPSVSAGQPTTPPVEPVRPVLGSLRRTRRSRIKACRLVGTMPVTSACSAGSLREYEVTSF